MAKASLITQVGANYLEKADNLSDVASKDTSKLNLEVPNVGTAANEVSVNGMLGTMAFQSSAGVVVDDLTVDGQLTAAVGKPMPVNGPTMRFDGSNDYVEFADNNAFSFTNGTDDLPFSISGWVKMEDATNFCPVSKFATVNKEWGIYFDGSDKLNVFCYTDGSNYIRQISDSALTAYEGSWIHIAFTYGGSGPNSSTAFPSGYQELTVYINGQPVDTTGSVAGTYAGMSNTSQPVYIGRANAAYSKGEIRDVKLFNKELSAAEVREVYSNGQLPESFAESTGGASIYTGDSSNFAGGLGNWTEEGSTSLTVAASGGEMVITNTAGASGGTKGARNLVDLVTEGKKLRLTFTARCSSGTATGFTVKMFNGSTATSATKIQGSGTASTGTSTIYSFTPTGSNETHIVEFVLAGSATDKLYYNISADGTGEVYNFDNITLTQLGAVLDARAEQFDTSTGKLYDLSGNDFVGTQSGGVSLLGREFPVFETGTFTPSIRWAAGNTGLAHTTQEGFYTRIGNTVNVRGRITLSNKGSDSGLAYFDGLPLSPVNGSGNIDTLLIGGATSFTGLTGSLSLQINKNNTTATFRQMGSSGVSYVMDTSFTNTSAFTFSGTYQIQ